MKQLKEAAMPRALIAAGLVLLLVSCGGSGADEDTSDGNASSEVSQPVTSETTHFPTCATQWAGQAPLDDDYSGCEDETGAMLAAQVLPCKDGSTIVVQDDYGYGYLGEIAYSFAMSDPALRGAQISACQNG